jgi:hypothetical protein
MTWEWTDVTDVTGLNGFGSDGWEVVCMMPYSKEEIVELRENYGEHVWFYRVLMKRVVE